MKVVLFCGGLGLRIRDYSESVPKPLVPIGERPILWHVMKYYAHYGHKDFILCLGYRAEAIKEFFLNYDECLSNDFVFSEGGKKLLLSNSDIHDWNITFANTGSGLEYRPAIEGGEEISGGRGSFSRELYRRAYRSAASVDDRAASTRQGHCDVFKRPAEFELSHCTVGEQRHGGRNPGDDQGEHPHQFRLLRARARRFSITSAKAKSWCRSHSSG